MRIKDIAAEADVSPATVSRYLNGHFDAMGADTRERIAEVIERTGYRPSVAARSLRTDRSYMLGVIMADIQNPYSGAMLEELDARAAKRGYSLMCATSGNDPEREAAAVERLVSAGVDGLIVNTCSEEGSVLVEANRRVPVVLLDRDVTGSPLDLVTSNNAQLTAGLVGELAERGCTRVCLLSERDATSSVRRVRARAFAAEAERLGLAGGVSRLGEDTGRNVEVVSEALARKTGEAFGGAPGNEGVTFGDGSSTPDNGDDVPGGSAPSPTGLIAVNGVVFLRLVEALDALGVRVPADARLATFDDYAWNHVLYGGVTTAVQDTATIAEAVLERTLERVEQRGAEIPRAKGAAAPGHVEVPGRVIARASTRG